MDGTPSITIATEHAAAPPVESPPICCTSTAACEAVNGERGPERGRAESVNTAVNSPGSEGRERGPCFPVRSPIGQARGASGEQREGLLCVCVRMHG